MRSKTPRIGLFLDQDRLYRELLDLHATLHALYYDPKTPVFGPVSKAYSLTSHIFFDLFSEFPSRALPGEISYTVAEDEYLPDEPATVLQLAPRTGRP